MGPRYQRNSRAHLLFHVCHPRMVFDVLLFFPSAALTGDADKTGGNDTPHIRTKRTANRKKVNNRIRRGFFCLRKN